MASTTTDDGFHEIQLNGKQLVFLFMAVTVVSVVIFLCGVLVGRGVGGDRDRSDLIAGELVAPAPPASASSPGPAPPATAAEDLSYPNRLAGTDQPREQLRDAARQPPASPPVEEPQRAAGRAAAEAPPAAAATPPVTEATPPVAAEPAGAGFAIQLAALRQRDEADVIARRLIGKGFPAYVLSPEAGAPPVFRVRVGKFKDRREAEAVATRLQKEEQFNPWIVR